MDFEQLLKMDIITWLQPEFDRGSLFVDRDSKKISRFRTYDTSTPWEHILQDQDLECRNFQLLFTHLKVLPTRCRECWKVVVKPRTLQELFEIRKVLEVVAKEHVIGCKLGIEERDWVPSYYGAYFYNRGRERGEECFELVSDLVGKAVSIDIPVYLKNSCTEMEMASKGWQNYKRNPDDDARERWFFENIEEVDHREQPVFLKLRVWRRWIAWAWKWDRDSRPWIEDMFNDGNPLYWQPKPVMWNDATLIRKEVLMINPNIKLLAAIRGQGWRQVDFAEIVGEHPSTISRVVNGWFNLDEGRQVKFAEALNKTVEELFGE